jgi:hypothetical protein
MSHFAKVENGIVVNVIVAEQDFINLLPDVDNWIQTSYNTRGGIHYEPNSNSPSADQSKALRKNYAGVGYTYDSRLDAFIPPQPFESWILNEQTCLWEAPIPMPQDGKSYRWNEELTQWEEIKV